MKNRIHEYRVKKKITQAELAEILEISRETVVRLEKGKYNPSMKTAVKLSEYFGVSVDDLFYHNE